MSTTASGRISSMTVTIGVPEIVIMGSTRARDWLPAEASVRRRPDGRRRTQASDANRGEAEQLLEHRRPET
jgi:hypothetical protein